MRSKEDLHGIIHKLKNHFNDLVKIKNNKLIKLNELKEKTKGLNKQIEDKLAFSDIDFPNEKISIEDYEKFKNSNETKETIRIKIEKLIIEKNKISEKFNDEVEFKKQINNLILIENQNIADLYNHHLEMKEKISTIKIAERDLIKNNEEKLRKEKIFVKVKHELDQELMKLEDVTDFQTRNHKKMIEELKAKNDENQKFMKEIDMKDINLDKEHRKNADKVLSEINTSKMIKMQNTEKESYVIKLILGLDIIKRYFIDIDRAHKEINTEILLKSEDMKTFYSDKFSIRENLDSISSGTTPFNSENQVGPNLKSTSDFSYAEKSTKCYITLKSLKDKLDNLDIDYEKIYDFYTKIMNKTNFFHNQMINFNSKQIALESRKEFNLKRVREIIVKNKKNIEGLEKFDKKFITLFNKFENEIDTGNLFDNLKEKINSFDSSPSFVEEFYNKCKIYFSDMKTLNEFIKFNFKKMKIECRDENLKNILKEKYKIFKENIRNEKNFKMINNIEYVQDLLKIVEIEFSKESKKLEKINRVIESFPPSRKSKSIKREKTLNSNMENGNGNENLEEKEECIENTLVPIDLNLNEINNRDDLDIDNFVDGDGNRNLNGNVELNLEEKSEILSQERETKTDKDFFEYNNNTAEKNSTKKTSPVKIEEKNGETDKSVKSQSNKNSEVSCNIYIAPYSGWSFEKLEEEREISLQKVEILKKYIEVGKFFEDQRNVINLRKLEVPFEKTLFYFFENTDKIVDNIQLSNNMVDTCKNMIDVKKINSPELVKKISLTIKEGKITKR